MAAERVRVLSGGADDEVVRIQQLRKVYPVNSRGGGIDLWGSVCSAGRKLVRLFGLGGDNSAGRGKNKGKEKKNSSFKVAVQSLCFGIPKGQCFGFLGRYGIETEAPGLLNRPFLGYVRF